MNKIKEKEKRTKIKVMKKKIAKRKKMIDK